MSYPYGVGTVLFTVDYTVKYNYHIGRCDANWDIHSWVIDEVEYDKDEDKIFIIRGISCGGEKHLTEQEVDTMFALTVNDAFDQLSRRVQQELQELRTQTAHLMAVNNALEQRRIPTDV